MLKNANFAAAVAFIYAMVYVCFMQFPGTVNIAIGMFLFSPAIVIWMVFTILRHGKYKGNELARGQEYGYEDR